MVVKVGTTLDDVATVGWLGIGGGDVYSCDVDDGVDVKVGTARDTDVAVVGCRRSDEEDWEDGRRKVAGLKLGAGADMGAGCVYVGC